ncbi:MAG: glycosyltransferase family 2 protein [Candidatus Aegiribacteria sp.]|nr:glycosyltransferase family 2 protein [Candidatus Aegiribacteria sp.]
MSGVMNMMESLREACPDNASTVAIIVPVYNEESILESQLVPVLKILPSGFRILVVENGSTDRTKDLLNDLEERYPALDSISLPLPNYGLAMKVGLIKSRADIFIIDDLDVLDTDFWIRGLRLLCTDDVDLIQGSKVLAGKDDRRPLIRKAATLTLTFLLRSLLGYRGTDTHGPKVVWRDAIKDIPPRCQYELDIFPTELVIRAHKSGVRIREIPIHLREIRVTPLPLYKRVPRALRDIWYLHRSLSRRGWG